MLHYLNKLENFFPPLFTQHPYIYLTFSKSTILHLNCSANFRSLHFTMLKILFSLKTCVQSDVPKICTVEYGVVLPELVREQAGFRCGYKQRLYWTENISTGEERFRGQLVWTWNLLPHRRMDGSGWHKPRQRQRRWSRQGSLLIRASGWAIHYESAEDQERRMPKGVHGSLNAQRGAGNYFCSYEHWSLNETRQGR